MSIAWLTSFADSAKATLSSQMAKYNNANFKNAAMAACALVSAADGTIEPEEKKKVAQFIGSSDLLKAFNGAELGQLFLDYCGKATDDFARLDLMAHVKKLKGSDQADMAIKVAIAIANADGEFEPEEKVVVTDMCKALGLDPSGYIS